MIELKKREERILQGQCGSERGIRKDRAGRVRIHRW